MNNHSRSIVCLLARDAGLECLRALIDRRDAVDVKGLFTHRFLPKSESDGRPERAEYLEYQKTARQFSIPFYPVDSKEEASRLESKLGGMSFDFLISCSWRYRVTADVLKMARIGCINLHRGKLPEYAGAEPVRRALLDHQASITMTAHVMDEAIDSGEVLSTIERRVEILPGESLEERVRRIKKTLVPYYSTLMFEGLEALLGRRMHEKK